MTFRGREVRKLVNALGLYGEAELEELFDGVTSINDLISKISLSVPRCTDEVDPANPDEVPKNAYDVLFELYMVLKKIPDRRDQKLVVYPLPDILMYAIFAHMGKQFDWDSVADYAHNHKGFFEKFGDYASKTYADCPLYNGLPPFHQSLYTKPVKRRANNIVTPHTDACGDVISTPRADTFLRTFTWLNGGALCKNLAEFTEKKIDEAFEVMGITKETFIEHYALDGKADRGSAQYLNTPLQEDAAQVVSLLNVSTGICYESRLNEIEIEENSQQKNTLEQSNSTGNANQGEPRKTIEIKKTNEIPIAQDILMDLANTRGSLSHLAITLDALHCQYKTIDIIADNGGLFAIQVKSNQKTLYEKCVNVYADLDDGLDDLLAEDGIDHSLIADDTEKKDLMIEDLDAADLLEEDGLVKVEYDFPGSKEVLRKYYLCMLSDPPSNWENATGCVCVVRNSFDFSKLEDEDSISYYIVNFDNINLASALIRRHWIMHFNMDTTFLVDKRRNRDHNCVRNVGIVIKFVLSILQFSSQLMRVEKKPMPLTNVINNLNSNFDKYIRVILSVFSRPSLERLRRFI